MMPRPDAEPEFVFPTNGPLPHHAPFDGLSLGNAGMRGVFQAGVIHAFVLCGYYPETVAGTSAGAINGAALALAAERRKQAERLAVVKDLISAWEENPAEDVRRRLLDPGGPLAKLANNLVGIDLPLGELIPLLDGAFVGKNIFALGRLAWALPERGKVILGALSGLVRALGERVLGKKSDFALEAVQGVLDAYGICQALLPTSAIEGGFAAMVEKHGPRREKTTFEDLPRTRLLVRVANLTRRDPQRHEVLLETLGRCAKPGVAGLRSVNLIGAMRAASAFAPLYPGVAMKELVDEIPLKRSADDILMDAAFVEKDPLSPIVGEWAVAATETKKGPYRLFVTYLDPMGDIPPPAAEDASFFGAALHSLRLLGKLDQRYPAKVVSIVTQMVDAIETAGVPLPERRGGRYVAVYRTEMAPRDPMPFHALGVTTKDTLRHACAMGCRAALESLHVSTIRERHARGASLDCADVLAEVRERVRPVQEAAGAEPVDAFFRPIDALCARCPRVLRTPLELEKDVSADALPSTASAEERRSVSNHVSAFAPPRRDASAAAGAEPEPRSLTVVVPAGGVFLGVFQVGAVAALREYKYEPNLYAGASVGTLFSYVLHASLQRGEVLPKLIEKLRTVPDWVDARAGGGRGAVDVVTAAMKQRWKDADALRAFRPRDIVRLLAAPHIAPESDDAKAWEKLQNALDRFLFTPIPDAPSYEVAGGHASLLDRNFLRSLLADASRLDLLPAAHFLDGIAARMGFFDPASPPDGEIIGFHGVEQVLRDIVFSDRVSTLWDHSEDQKARFIFTVVNFTRGILQHFGYNDGPAGARLSPQAIQACLAASSFPLAFKRRSRRTVFANDAVDLPDTRYTDGGTLNNFPSDSAFAYLHACSGVDGTRWIGAAPHRVILLSLTSPTPMVTDAANLDRLLFTTSAAYARGEDEKVLQTLRGQDHINNLARVANPILEKNKAGQGIRAKITWISPTYTIYPHAFAFKKGLLGFSREKQDEMLASGCRRTRIALEWDVFRVKPAIDILDPEDRKEEFRRALRWEVEQVKTNPEADGKCVFGTLTPSGEMVTCSFKSTGDASLHSIHDTCRRTVDRELSVPDLKLHLPIYPA